MNTVTRETSKNISQNAKNPVDRYAALILAIVIAVAGYWVIDLATQDSLLLVTIKDVFNGMAVSIMNLASRC